MTQPASTASRKPRRGTADVLGEGGGQAASGSRELAALSVPGNHLEDGRLDREMVGTDSAASW